MCGRGRRLKCGIACSICRAPRVAYFRPVLEVGLVASSDERVHLAVGQHLDKMGKAMANVDVHGVYRVHGLEHGDARVVDTIAALQLARRACGCQE